MIHILITKEPFNINLYGVYMYKYVNCTWCSKEIKVDNILNIAINSF